MSTVIRIRDKITQMKTTGGTIGGKESVFHSTKTTLSLASVIGGEMLLRAANFATAVLIGRVYGVALFATYATVLAFVTVVERLADNGLEVAGIAEVSEHPEQSGAIVGTLYTLKTIFSSLALLVLVVIGRGTGLSLDGWILASVLSVRTFLYSYCRLHAGVMKSLDKMPVLGVIQSSHFLLLVGGIWTVYVRHYSIHSLLAVLLAGQCLEFLASFFFLRHIGVRPHATALMTCLQMIRRATPIGIAYTIAAMMLRGDVIILSLMVSPALLGSFAAANTGLVMIYVIAWLFGGVILAKMSRLATDERLLASYARTWAVLVLATTVPLSVLAAFTAPSILIWLFGRAFASAASSAGIMALAVPLILLNTVFLSFAIARRAVREYVGVFVAAGVLSITLDFLLGRTYGANGVAWAIVLREAAIASAFSLHALTSSRILLPRTSRTGLEIESVETVDA